MFRMPILAPLAFIMLSACASHEASSPPERGQTMRGEHHSEGRPTRPGAGDSFTRAARLVDAEQYGQALPALRCISGQGRGFEIAQYLAGYSALKMSFAPDTPEILRADLRYEGFERLINAANAGWPAAQAELARVFLATGTDEAVGEAAYWAAIYRRNSRDRAYGLDRLDGSTEVDIEASMSVEDFTLATARASEFVIADMTAIPTTSQCAPFLRTAPRRQSRGERAQGPREGGRRGGGRQGGGRSGGLIEAD
jgi:hypothetical protein